MFGPSMAHMWPLVLILVVLGIVVLAMLGFLLWGIVYTATKLIFGERKKNVE